MTTPETPGEQQLPLPATIHPPFIIENWRANQFLTAIEANLHEDLSEEYGRAVFVGSYWAANRASRYESAQEASQLSSEEQKVVGLLGGEQFMEIYHAAPPKEIVDSMLSSNRSGYAPPNLESLTVAVIKGEIEWDDRFDTAGVPKPEVVFEASEEKLRKNREDQERRARLTSSQDSEDRSPFRRTVGGIINRLRRAS